jgi:hypothetical protein
MVSNTTCHSPLRKSEFHDTAKVVEQTRITCMCRSLAEQSVRESGQVRLVDASGTEGRQVDWVMVVAYLTCTASKAAADTGPSAMCLGGRKNPHVPHLGLNHLCLCDQN